MTGAVITVVAGAGVVVVGELVVVDGESVQAPAMVHSTADRRIHAVLGLRHIEKELYA